MTNEQSARGHPCGNGSAPLLEVEGVTVRFGGIVALDGVSFTVNSGQICGLIGPNGAGKSTFFNCLSRIYDCGAGRIAFRGEDLSKVARHRVASLGIGRTFQNVALFKSMTVRDNVLVGCHSHARTTFPGAMFRTRRAASAEEAANQQADRVIDVLELRGVAGRAVADLPFGTQKRVELARALATHPTLLLLDEPACGLNHEEMDGLGALILKVRQQFDVTILLVEHHMSLVMAICDKIVVLNFGKKISEGIPSAVRNHPEVVSAYLGNAHAASPRG